MKSGLLPVPFVVVFHTKKFCIESYSLKSQNDKIPVGFWLTSSGNPVKNFSKKNIDFSAPFNLVLQP